VPPTARFSMSHFQVPMAAGRLAKMAATFAASAARSSLTKQCVQSNNAVQRTKLMNVLAAPHRLFAATLTSTCSAPNLRAFSISASASASADKVSTVVAEELKYEQDNYTKPEVQAPCFYPARQSLYALCLQSFLVAVNPFMNGFYVDQCTS
jgi:sulfite reductase alpha subunit-like flavoprotein